MQQAIAYGTIFLVLGLGLWRPRLGQFLQIGPATAAVLGVFVLLATGGVSVRDLEGSFEALWRPSLTIMSLMLTTSVAQRLGLLQHFVERLDPAGGQPAARLFRSVFVASAITSAVLNNDAAVLLLTPLIVGLVRRRYPHRPDLVRPFAFSVFSAAGVAPLVISNPMNLVVAEYAGIGFNDYAARMIPISIAGWVSAYFMLRLVFRRQLRGSSGAAAGQSDEALSVPAKQFLLLLLVLLGSYPALSYADGPVWAVATAGAFAAALLSWRHGVASPVGLVRGLSWDILVFLFCVFVVVLGLRKVGLVDQVSALYASAATASSQTVLVGIVSTLGSAVLNNHPMAILNALALSRLPGNTEQQVLAALIGGDLGPRLLPIGSLAGLLWLDSLGREGCRVSLASFVGVGAAVTGPTLALSLAMLLGGK